MKVFEYYSEYEGDFLKVSSEKEGFLVYSSFGNDGVALLIPTPQAVRLAYAILESVGAR